ncbi:hypothetical protein QBZ16_003271 [Prototheca wickerhamii]|uniref:Uncharacterized protein n=1 Tax=Prototheca wickerhamii TaxID=3111 RepID=A0AAD9IIP3_PROWI|nr:hypothetical protein QBZ16_003271 [Prototheca wickerhamii]
MSKDLPQVRFGLPGASAASIAQEWYHDESVSVQEALKLLVTRIQTSGPVKQHHLQALYQRCKTGDELDRALKLTRLNYLARGALQQHAPFSHRTSKTLVQQAMQLGVPELAARALEHSAEFGLPADSVKEATPLLIYYSKQGDLLKMLEVYEVIKRQGRHPGPDVCYVLVKGCVDWGRADLARLIIKEFEAAGVRTRQGTLAYLNRRPSMGIESALPTAAEFAGALTDDGAVVERNAARA